YRRVGGCCWGWEVVVKKKFFFQYTSCRTSKKTPRCVGYTIGGNKKNAEELQKSWVTDRGGGDKEECRRPSNRGRGGPEGWTRNPQKRPGSRRRTSKSWSSSENEGLPATPESLGEH